MRTTASVPYGNRRGSRGSGSARASRAGVLVVDLRDGSTPHWGRFSGVVEELYDVAVLEGVVRPQAVGFASVDIRRYPSFPPQGAEEKRAPPEPG